MQNSERTKKRKADLLLDSAKKCQKLSDLFGQTRQQAATTSPAASQLLTVVSQPTNQLSIVMDRAAETSGSSTHVTEADVLLVSTSQLTLVKQNKVQNKRHSVSFYKGIKLDLNSLLKNNNELERFDATRDSKKRVHVACKLCRQYIDEAKKYSRNGTVPIAIGVRADDEDRLKLIVDHLQSEAHNAVKNLDKLHKEWEKGSDKHPWLKVLTTHKADLIKFLVGMAYDVYNNCLCDFQRILGHLDH